jgi:hypothetical protein
VEKPHKSKRTHKDNLRTSEQNLKKKLGKSKELAGNIRRGMPEVSLRHPRHD